MPSTPHVFHIPTTTRTCDETGDRGALLPISEGMSAGALLPRLPTPEDILRGYFGWSFAPPYTLPEIPGA